ncbi:MAG TPA: 4a-hydroxytetrahydrobiopterin dehydratase [Acidimicrobiales bacterium]|nr:4a-hydroxytetrahydrobiopterin dehydratase [Acidimicrobiales bacterium]
MELMDPTALGVALLGLEWQLEGGELVKVVRRHDFAEALQYVNAVGRLAESVGHHPDIELRWNTVTLHLLTHSLGGLTDADVDLAARIDALG